MTEINWSTLHPNVSKLFKEKEQPILALAPMEDVTILPFRRIAKRFGADLVYTEFVPAAGLVREIESILKKLEYEETERPLTVQLYGAKPDEMARAAKMVEKIVAPDFIDINLGCPVKKIAGRGEGAGMLKPDGYEKGANCLYSLPPMNLRAVVCSVVDAVTTPVTVKMRLGWDKQTMYVVESMPWFKEWGVQFIALHGRTKEQAYTGTADWKMITEAKEASQLPLIGNGDITSASIGVQRWVDSKVDGLMIGRGAITAPWIFRDLRSALQGKQVEPIPPLRFRIETYLAMIEECIPSKGEYKAVIEMRKFIPGFLCGEYNAAHVRKDVVRMDTYKEVSDRMLQYVVERETYHSEHDV